MKEHTEPNRGLDDSQAAQLPALADRPLEEIEAVAEVLVEVRSISSQLTPNEVRAELSARLDRMGLRLPDADLEELVEQLAPAPQ
ncbi:MAG TPA: hypothetical protein DIW46_12055 [Microbacterium sp.]|uniref:hypothetical protein n=1 Tax=Leucobacter sp. G161 TaxID=663704 RepID=UPI00073D079B|nr:hypothetical protein [Leucobacter sp. G161]KUF05792.1 hypothetical protein AUL38_15410 [Leucobacter sp. G161]HCS62105.1 hypothetical protein [Microbacterium sp.]